MNNLPRDEDGNIKPGPGRPSFREMILKVGAEFDGDMTKTERAVRSMFKLAEGTPTELPDVSAFKAIAQHAEGTKNEEKGEQTLKIVVVDETI